jgi:hypothetical protein
MLNRVGHPAAQAAQVPPHAQPAESAIAHFVQVLVLVLAAPIHAVLSEVHAFHKDLAGALLLIRYSPLFVIAVLWAAFAVSKALFVLALSRALVLEPELADSKRKKPRALNLAAFCNTGNRQPVFINALSSMSVRLFILLGAEEVVLLFHLRKP